MPFTFFLLPYVMRRLIVGLGNPGAEYARTRHNLGFMLVDLLAEQSGELVKRKECRALVGAAKIEDEPVLLVKPQTYMNLSGESVSCLLAKKEQVRPAAVMIVISDDLALPFGTIRLRRRARGAARTTRGARAPTASCP